MSEYYGLAGDIPLARKPLVKLEKEYSRLVQEAIRAALSKSVDAIRMMLITSAYSPVPKDTGFLREHLQVEIRGGFGEDGVSLWLSWEGVPYAEHLIRKAGQVQVRHADSGGRSGARYDPMAENPWMEPAMKMVFPLVLNAFQNELGARGIEYTQS